MGLTTEEIAADANVPLRRDGSDLLVAGEDLSTLVDECIRRRVWIYGIEGFLVNDKEFRATSEIFTSGAGTWSQVAEGAKKFAEVNRGSGLDFALTLGDTAED